MTEDVTECVIFVGLPGAGKSTLYRERFAATHQQISKDLSPHATAREQRQQKMIGDALSVGNSVVIDNTNPTTEERARIIDIARQHSARIVGYFFDVSTRTAVARNSERSGRAKVPNVAIFTAAKRLQPPSYEEGFDQLFRVTIADDRSLRVSEVAR